MLVTYLLAKSAPLTWILHGHGHYVMLVHKSYDHEPVVSANAMIICSKSVHLYIIFDLLDC